LVASGEVHSTVVCPVPWFFSSNARFGDYGRMAATPRKDVRHGIAVSYPRYPQLPKFGMNAAPYGMFLGVRRLVRTLHAEIGFQAIDAHYFYPDGVAAVMLGDALGLPVVITARGSDINLIPKFGAARKKILWAAAKAFHMVTVCQALKDEMDALGVDTSRVTVLRNGVDLDLFRPRDREAARAKHDCEGRTLVSVGHLIPRKGHDLIIKALPRLTATNLLIVGSGPERSALQQIGVSSGVAERVRFLGEVSQETLAELYSAADALVLASSREGWANVLLESMACGTPVVASNVWGTPEVVRVPEAGVLMQERTPDGVAAACERLFDNYPDRAHTRRYAEQFSWDNTTKGQLEVFGGAAASAATNQRRRMPETT